MKITPEADTYDLPPFSMVESVEIERRTCGPYILLHQISAEEMERVRKGQPLIQAAPIRGIPVRCWVSITGFIMFDPWPDRDYEVRVRYFPPLREA